MIKLKLTEEIEKEHLKYFLDVILPKLAEPPSSKEELKEEYEKFYNFCKEKNNTRRIAVGTPQDLKDIIDEVSILFPLMKDELDKKPDKKEETQSEKKVKEGSDFSKALQKKFGYDDFIKITDLSDYIKSRAKTLFFLEKGVKRANYGVSLSSYAHQAIAEVFLDYKPSEECIKMTKEDVHKLLLETRFTITLDTFSRLKQELLPWSAYKLALLNNVTVCPYCNRQYITPVFSDNGKVRGEFDHFFPKSQYPYLSMSLYNLIPSCSACNSSLKGQKEFSIHDIHPYEENYHNFFDFYINPVDQANPRVEIEIHGKKEKETEKYLKMFQIEALYNYHSNQGIEMFQKSVIYPESYLDELMNFGKKQEADIQNTATDGNEYNPEDTEKLIDIGKMFDSKEELKALIYGYILDEKDISKEAFGKLRRDVAKQLGLIE